MIWVTWHKMAAVPGHIGVTLRERSPGDLKVDQMREGGRLELTMMMVMVRLGFLT